MAHRVFRLSIAPERAPEVRRVFDFDGRSTLHDVHAVIQREFHLDDDHLYAFYLSGRYFDASSEHSLSSDSAHDSKRSVLFRLRLNVGQQLAVEGDCVATTHNEVRPSAMELDKDVAKVVEELNHPRFRGTKRTPTLWVGAQLAPIARG
jgi:hypothetical protein